MFLKISLADDIVPKTHLFVGKNYSKRKQLKKFSEYLFVLDNLLKTKGLRYYLFLLRYTNGLT